MLKRVLRLLLAAIFIVTVGWGWAPLYAVPTNIIFFIGDGMGFEQVKAANFYAGEPLSFERLPHQGQCTTYSASSSVTDSAAAATAIATATKVNNGVVSLAYPGDGSELETLLEYMQRVSGKSTGLVTSTYLAHATPAAFGAHEPSRYNYAQIASDYLNQTRPNVLFGGGGNGMSVAAAQAAGYLVATNSSEFESLSTTYELISAQFGTSHLPYEYDYLGSNYPYPHLADMVVKALDALDDDLGNDPDGFFLMVEGGRIDHACHDNKLQRAVHEALAFSDAVQAALEWVAGREDTLILVTADHETGGLTVTGDNGPGNYPSVSWSSSGHTSANVPIYAWGANAELVSGVMDNTEIFGICTAGATPIQIATNPNPRDGATDVPRDGDLAWTASTGAMLYNVYMGTDPDNLPEVSFLQLDTSYDPGSLDMDTTWYWRVDEVDAAGNVVTGNTWRFTTLAPPTPATDPDPAHGAIDVSVNTILSWTMGARAESQHVYFGTHPNPPFQTEQSGTIFKPNMLSPHTIYYWRIDQINDAGITKGSVFSFTTVAGARPQTVRAHSEDTRKGNVISGDWFHTHASDGDYEAIQEVGKRRKRNSYSRLDHTWTFTVAGGNSAEFFVEAWHTASSDGDDFVFSYSQDGYSFTKMLAITKTKDTDTPQAFVFPVPLQSGALYIRVRDTDRRRRNSSLDTLFIDDMYVVTSQESIPHYTAGRPTPTDGAEGVVLDPVLNWTPGNGATTHHLYLSTDREHLKRVVQGHTDPTHAHALLEPLTTYYWRVDEVRSGGQVAQGPVWAFTTTYTGECLPFSRHVGTIATSTVRGSFGKKYGAATVTVVDNCGGPVPGALVTGTFSGDFKETRSGVTNSDGVVILQTSTALKRPKFGLIVDELN